MSFIGNRPDSFGYSSTSYDHFSGTGSQTVYTLTRSVSANADIFVTVNNVPQDPGVAYYVTNLNTLTFTSAPSSVANNIVVVYRNFVQTGLALGANTVTSFTIAPGAVQAYQISSVSNTSITGNIISSQITSVANTQITGNITSGQITSVANTQLTGLITSAQLAPFGTLSATAFSGPINGTIGATTPATGVFTTSTSNSFIPNSSSIPTNGVYLPATNAVGIATNSTARFQVNASGIITKPYQPAFFATGNQGSVTITQSSNIPFNSLNAAFAGSNRNSGYNTSTYAYTAPVSGLYYFYAQFYMSSAGSLAWLKNDSQLAFQDIALWTFYAPSGVTQISGGTMIVELSAGDYVSTRVRSGNGDVTGYMGHSCFLGYLIG